MKLNPGDKVGIISPSSFLRNREAVELGLDYLRSLKLEPAPLKTAPPICTAFTPRRK